MHRPSRRPSEMSEIDNTSCLSFQMPACSATLFDGIDGGNIRERVIAFNEMLRQLHLATNKSNESLARLSSAQKKFQNDPAKDTPSNREKLAHLYRTSVKDTETEAELTRKALSTIFDIRAQVKQKQKKMSYGISNQTHLRRGQLMKILNDCANTLPLFIGKSLHDRPPQLCGAIAAESNYVAKSGDLVAALVKNQTEGEDNWILAEVVHYVPSSSKYEVDDIDEEQKDRHMLSKRKVIPLPTMRANPETNPEALFQKGTLVLALYPQTTCFYKAVVQEPPHTASDNYHVLFEDSSYPEGYSPPLEVPQRYVIYVKEVKSK